MGSPLLKLPLEMLSEIIQYVDDNCVFTKLPLVCKRLNEVVKADRFRLFCLVIKSMGNPHIAQKGQFNTKCKHLIINWPMLVHQRDADTDHRYKLRKAAIVSVLEKLKFQLVHLTINIRAFTAEASIPPMELTDFFGKCTKLDDLVIQTSKWNWTLHPICPSIRALAMTVMKTNGTYTSFHPLFDKLPSLTKLTLRRNSWVENVNWTIPINWGLVPVQSMDKLVSISCDRVLPSPIHHGVAERIRSLELSVYETNVDLERLQHRLPQFVKLEKLTLRFIKEYYIPGQPSFTSLLDVISRDLRNLTSFELIRDTSSQLSVSRQFQDRLRSLPTRIRVTDTTARILQ